MLNRKSLIYLFNHEVLLQSNIQCVILNVLQMKGCYMQKCRKWLEKLIALMLYIRNNLKLMLIWKKFVKLSNKRKIWKLI